MAVRDEHAGRRSHGARDIKVDGKAVSGTWETTKVEGTFTDGVLELSFPFNSPEAGAGTLGVKAKLVNDELIGDWTFQSYGGTLKATRVKE